MVEGGIPMVKAEFPGEIRFTGNDEITVGDVNVSKWLKAALGGAPRLHVRMKIEVELDPITTTYASTTLGGAFQEPAEVK